MKKQFRTMLTVLPLAYLAGCGNTADVVRAGRLLLSAVDGMNEKIPLETAAAVPFASMGLELGSSPQVMLVLGTSTSDELGWFVGRQLFVATRQGRVVRTAGLPYDLGGYRRLTANQPGVSAISYTVDFPDLGAYGAAVLCTQTDRGDDTVSILGTGIPTRHIIEHCSAPSLRWTFDNEYWEDRTTRYIWRSRQYVHPKSAAIVLEVFRPEEPPPG